jgi:hypothetical protein
MSSDTRSNRRGAGLTCGIAAVVLALSTLAVSSAAAATGHLVIRTGNGTVGVNDPKGCVAVTGGPATEVANYTDATVALYSVNGCNGIPVRKLAAGATAIGSFSGVLVA